MYLRAANVTNTGLDLGDVLKMDFTPDERERFRLQAGDVVLAEASGSARQVGRAALWEDELKECCHQNTVIRFRPHAVIPEYALLAFGHLRQSGEIANAARGVGIQHVGTRRLSGLTVPLPPWDEQGRIVEEANRRLGELGNAEADLRSAKEKVEEYKKEIYAAAASGTIVERGTKLAHEQTLEERPETIPDGWSLASIGEVGSVQLGITRSPARLAGSGARKYLRSANIADGELDLGTIAEMEISEAEAARFDLQDGDVLIAEASGSPKRVGRSVVWRGEVTGCSYQNHIIRLRSDDMLPEYLHLVISHYRYSGVLAEVAKGVGIQHLGAGRFSRLRIPVPPKWEQREIIEEAQKQLGIGREQDNAVRESLKRVEQMKKEVVSAAVSGELVAQRDGEETATAMLARLGSPPKISPRKRRRKGKEAVEGTLANQRASEHGTVRLVDVLRKEDRALSAAELFLLAGFDRNSPEQVELFYLELRKEVGSRLRTVGDLTENQLLEVIPDALE